MTREAICDCIADLSAIAEQCGHRRRCRISEAMSKSVNCRSGWNGQEKRKLHAGRYAFEFTPGHQPRRFNTPALRKAT
jgi:hypothetical protein